MRTLTGTQRAGINRVLWDFSDANQRALPAGEYTATLQVGEQKLTQKAQILPRVIDK